ncbi:signal peptidase II [Rhodobacter sp.]
MRLLALSAAITFALDQATKLGVLYGMNLLERHEIDLLPPFLVFRMAWNQGINFGLLSGQTEWMRWILILVALAISVWVVMWVRKEPANRPVQLAGGMLVGGAIGNVVDRLVYGAVADFLNMSCCGIENPYAFNVADIAIFAGAFGLVVFAGKSPSGKGGTGGKRRQAGKPARKTP